MAIVLHKRLVAVPFDDRSSRVNCQRLAALGRILRVRSIQAALTTGYHQQGCSRKRENFFHLELMFKHDLRIEHKGT
jgi:hypothetical protein